MCSMFDADFGTSLDVDKEGTPLKMSVAHYRRGTGTFRRLFTICLVLCACAPVDALTWVEDTSVGSRRDWTSITSSSDGTKLAAVAHRGHIWISTDSGNTWTERVPGTDSNIPWTSITSSSNGTKLAAVGEFIDGIESPCMWTSTDSGATWTPTSAGTRV